MLVFPKHTVEAELQHNTHLSGYGTVAEEVATNRFDHYDDENWTSPEEKQKAIATNELWRFWWYEKKGGKRHFRLASTLDALMSSFGVGWKDVKFPDHKASLHLTHVIDESVTDKMRDQPEYYGDDDDWLSQEEREKALTTNEMWTLHWYPLTPVGFCLRHATDVNALLGSFEN